MSLRLILIVLLSLNLNYLFAQPIPAEEENIPFLVTFGTDADPSFGDDDHCQTFFF